MTLDDRLEPQIMNNLDQELDEIFVPLLKDIEPMGTYSGDFAGLVGTAKQAIQALITTQKQELLDEIEKELPEPAAHRYMSEENPCCIEAKAYDRALDQVKSIITTKRGD